MRPVVVLALLTLALARLAPASAAQAGGEINVISSAARVNFPASVTFSLEAESSAPITAITLQLNTPTQRYGAYPRNVRPEFQPGTRVAATWTWRRFGSSLPPGADVTYRWLITDAAGAVVETPVASVRVDDTRFQWREVRDGPVTVRWHEGGEAFGRELLATTTAAVTQLARDQGVELQTPVTVHVYASQNELYTALPGLPPWAGGISLGEFDMLLVPIAPQNMRDGRRALVHELAHQIVYQVTFNPSLGSKVPAWLNEGLAVVAEGDTSAVNRRLIEQAAAAGTLPTLRSLSTAFSTMPASQVELAYAASESVVRYLLASEGPEKMRALLVEFRDGRTADDALRRVYGRGVDEIEDRWRTSLGLRPLDRGVGNDDSPAPPAPASESRDSAGRWVILGSSAAIILALLVVFVLGLILLRRRQARI